MSKHLKDPKNTLDPRGWTKQCWVFLPVLQFLAIGLFRHSRCGNRLSVADSLSTGRQGRAPALSPGGNGLC